MCAINLCTFFHCPLFWGISGGIFGITLGYIGDICWISLKYLWGIWGVSGVYPGCAKGWPGPSEDDGGEDDGDFSV